MEWKRVIGKKRFLPGILLICLVGLFFFLQAVVLDFRGEKDSFGTGFAEAVQARKEVLEELRKMTPEEAAQVTSEAMMSSEWTLETLEQGLLAEQVEYYASYRDYLESVQTSAEQMRHISSMYQPGSFSQRNIDRTAVEFARIEREVGELTLMQQESVTSVTESGILTIVYLAVMAAFILVLTEENRNGLRKLVVSCRNGRQRLALQRLGLFALFAVVTGVFFYGVMFACAWWTYGIPNLGAPVQSMMAFQKCILPITVGEYIGLFLIGRIAAGMLAALFLWMCLQLFANLLEAILVVGGIGVLEFVLHLLIPVQSPANWLRFLNLVQLLATEEWFTRYQNLNFFSYAVSMRWILLGVSVIVLIAVLVGLFLLSGRRETRTLKIVEKLRQLWNRFTMWIFIHLGSGGREGYKILTIQKGFLVVLLLIVYEYQSLSGIQTIYYTQSEARELSCYLQWEGEVTEQKLADIQAELTSIEEQQAECQEKVEQYRKGELSAEDYYFVNLTSAQLNEEWDAIQRFQQKAMELQDLSEQTGIRYELVAPYGYRQLIGKDGRETAGKTAVLGILFLVLLFAGTFSYEYEHRSYTYLRISAEGRRKLVSAKFRFVLVGTLVLTLILFGCDTYIIWKEYGLTRLGAPVQSLDFLREFKGHCSIVQYLIWQNVSRFLILGAVSSVTVAISTAVKKTELAMGIAGVVLLLPSLLDRLGIHQFEKLAVGSLFTVSYPGVSMILLVCVLSAAVVAAGCMYTTWEWEK